MAWMRAAQRYLMACSVIVLSAALLNTSQAYAEAYISGQFGMALPSITSGLSNVKLTDFSPEGSLSDRSLQSSAMYGIKAGYFFPRARWFGVEGELFTATPHIKQQSTTITIPANATLNGFGPVAGGTTSGTVSGDHFRVMTVAANAMFRYHKTRLQPYIGVGPALFFARVNSTVQGFEGTQSSNFRVGLNLKAGVDFFITRRVSAFAEWKYNLARLSFGPTDNALGFDATYQMHLASVGLSYHF
jgi:opacity protein-like surface antigen